MQMWAASAAAAALLLPALPTCTASSLQSLEDPYHGEKRYPVSRVVNLLKTMKTQLENEGDMDQETYEKFAAWCEENDKQKTKAIADAEERLIQLQQTIEKNTAKVETSKVEITALEKEIAANQKSLEQATSMREKATAEFTEEEKEMLESIRALGAAVMVLSKHHSAGAALIEDGLRGTAAATSAAQAAAMNQAVSTAAAQLRAHSKLLRGVVTPQQRKLVSALSEKLGQPADYFDAAPTFKQSYAPQSGEIFGILQQMKETFEGNLAQSQKDELNDQETYKALKEAKESEIAAGQTALEDKKIQLATAEKIVAQSKSDREDTEVTLKADKEFLMDLKLKCQSTDQDWEERQKVRQDELKAVNEAISILSTDDARELFDRTWNDKASFLQLSAKRSAKGGRAKASEVLMSAAQKAGNPKMAALATKVRLDAFTQVKKAIDDMVAQLLKEADDEQVHKDFCVKELNTNEKDTAAGLHRKTKIEARIDHIKTNIDNLEATIATLNSEIDDQKKQREEAKKERGLQNEAFNATVTDQRQTQMLLGQALASLKAAYRTQAERHAEIDASLAKSSLVQVQAHKQTPEPKGFSEYEKQRGANPILALLEHILADAQAMEQEAIAAEDEAREAYQDFVQQTVRTVEAKQAAIIDRNQEKTAAEEDLLQAESEHSGAVETLQTLSTSLEELTKSCDWFLKNFDARTKAREEEVEALRQAKAFLSGMSS
eukprot:TRINITY_DN5689_c0_g1_i1.p1 TRINITY_DN5689_c0_g1~~TRINITY_DN5689_c0_g1_i1.p1  ORF type:complete len:721 (-),score=332.08 TRINITY_DN5689_c0_g1_i1:142-2304(-)